MPIGGLSEIWNTRSGLVKEMCTQDVRKQHRWEPGKWGQLQVSGRGPKSRPMDKILVRKKALWESPGDPVIKAQCTPRYKAKQT